MAPYPDDALRALAHPDRRRLLRALAEHNPQPDDTLHVPEDVPFENPKREQLRIRLYHTHLPKLEEAGLIHWDRDAHKVTKGPQFGEVRPLLNLLTESDESSPYE